ncbi:ABC transporter ATP-binding protein [Geovibrio thiophilus]|uniref:ABC transporter ATP-binding protein n=1 Tax=Geovibrio thiophilus TaxID=139438 RepID=A0A3R6AYJ9_9BACT|nr:ABC transporter ATP-binding protein [Geovibrio thiophilus]QAR33514.1 ABC transporter ATP-binding protein [Geovibrio thiophilus]
MIEVSGLHFGYSRKKSVLNGVSFRVGKGEIVNILGPNGCGKSTLIKLILGFMHAESGVISINGRDIRSIGRKRLASLVSYVPQMHSGVFSYSVLDVVLMGRVSMSPWYKYKEEDYEYAQRALTRLNLSHYAERPYLHLSGGERQLVLIARALAQKAEYFIMDEPVSGLDYGNQFLLLQVIKELSQEGLTVILTTHHPEHAVFLGGRSLLIKNGEVMGDGPSEDTINANCVCSLYNMPRSLVEQVSFTHYMKR